MDKTLKEITINILICVLMLSAFTFTSTAYIQNILKITEEDIKQNINEIETQCVNLLQERINRNKIYIESVANSIAIQNNDIDNQIVLDILQNKIQYSTFEEINVIKTNGDVLNDYGTVINNIYEQEQFNIIKSGETYISDVVFSDIEDKKRMIIAAPVIRNNEFVGAVVRCYSSEYINETLTVDIFGGMGYSYLSKSTGEIFGFSNNSGIDASFKNVALDFSDAEVNAEDLSSMLTVMKNGGSGEIFFKFRDMDKIMNYTPVEINDWYLLTVVPRDVISIRTKRLLNETAKLIIAIIGIIAFGMAYIFYLQRKSKRQLAASKQRYEVIMEQTQDIIFEWTACTHEIYYSKNFVNKFGYEPASENFPQCALEASLIHTEDINNFLSIFSGIEAGKNYNVTQLRIRKNDGNFIWCRISTTAMIDDDGKAYHGVGIISDIDEQVKNLIKIENAAKIDPLTKLYNRMHTEEYINKYLDSTDSPAAIMVIDIDDFKNINDTLGHAGGDVTLSAVANSLQNIFYDGIVGRYGGDEFVVFMEGTYDDNMHEKLLESITACEKSIINDQASCQISLSIGISFYPNDGKTYSELFEKADISLYYAKNHGKNRYAIYSEKLAEQSMLAQYSSKK